MALREPRQDFLDALLTGNAVAVVDDMVTHTEAALTIEPTTLARLDPATLRILKRELENVHQRDTAPMADVAGAAVEVGAVVELGMDTGVAPMASLPLVALVVLT